MTILKIAQLGHPILREHAREISREELSSTEAQQLIDDLVETMRDADGAGLAAIQVYRPVRIFAVEVRANNPRYPYRPAIPLTVLVNPRIEPLGDEMFQNYEGCLSVPNLRGVVARHVSLRVRGWDRHGAEVDEVVHGLRACTVQHECDHLDGRVFVDRVKDPTTFATWTEFDRYHRAGFAERARALVERFGS